MSAQEQSEKYGTAPRDNVMELKTAPITVQRVMMGLNRGVAVSPTTRGFLCDGPFKTWQIYDLRRSYLATELKETVHVAAEGQGVTMVGVPSNFFGATYNRMPAQYRLAGRIVGFSTRLCGKANWVAVKHGGERGNGTIVVDWQLYSVADERIIGRFRTEGAHEISDPVKRPIETLMFEALADATVTLVNRPDFRDMVQPGAVPLVESATPNDDNMHVTGESDSWWLDEGTLSK